MVGWLATGQSLGAVDAYLRGSLEIVSGYSEAMSFEDPNVGWEYWAAFLVIGLGFAVAWHAAWALPGRGKVGLVALWALLSFMSFKAGFVRHDPSHSNIFFASLLGGLVAFGWAPHRRRTAWLLGAIFALALFSSLRKDPADLIHPVSRASNLVDQARAAGRRRGDAQGHPEARIERVDKEQLDARFRTRDRGRHGARGAARRGPARGRRTCAGSRCPVFQTYSAYTAGARRAQRRHGALPDGPESSCARHGSDVRRPQPAFDAPEAMREMLCHFRAGARRSAAGSCSSARAPRCGR